MKKMCFRIIIVMSFCCSFLLSTTAEAALSTNIVILMDQRNADLQEQTPTSQIQITQTETSVSIESPTSAINNSTPVGTETPIQETPTPDLVTPDPNQLRPVLGEARQLIGSNRFNDSNYWALPLGMLSTFALIGLFILIFAKPK